MNYGDMLRANIEKEEKEKRDKDILEEKYRTLHKEKIIQTVQSQATKMLDDVKSNIERGYAKTTHQHIRSTSLINVMMGRDMSKDYISDKERREIKKGIEKMFWDVGLHVQLADISFDNMGKSHYVVIVTPL